MKKLVFHILCIGLLSLPVMLHAQDSQSTVTLHVVQRGETLYRIAQNYGVTIDDLVRLNGLTDPGSIDVGQRLLVPTAGVATSGSSLVHVVQPGESLDSIGALYGLTGAEIQALNGLPNGAIYVGQGLMIALPTAAPTTVPEVASLDMPPAVVHTVASGETLFRIAQSYGTTVNAIATANGINNVEIIYPGQRLVIPGVEPPQLTAALPAPITGFDLSPIVLIEGQAGRFHLQSSVPVTLSGSFLDQLATLATDSSGTDMVAIFGVPVGTEPGIYPATFGFTDATGANVSLTANVQVVSGGYFQSDNIQVTGDSSLLLDPAVEEAELATLRSFMSVFNPERYFSGTFGLPAAATITSGFGNVRSYNAGDVLRVHTGTDFGGAPGTPILAPAPGRVVFAGALDIRGNATVIDHGWGVYSGYWHQSAQYVQVGDVVTTGQVIGAIGATGRVSGPHLHWEIWVNGVPVDPMQWTVQPFA